MKIKLIAALIGITAVTANAGQDIKYDRRYATNPEVAIMDNVTMKILTGTDQDGVDAVMEFRNKTKSIDNRRFTAMAIPGILTEDPIDIVLKRRAHLKNTDRYLIPITNIRLAEGRATNHSLYRYSLVGNIKNFGVVDAADSESPLLACTDYTKTGACVVFDNVLPVSGINLPGFVDIGRSFDSINGQTYYAIVAQLKSTVPSDKIGYPVLHMEAYQGALVDAVNGQILMMFNQDNSEVKGENGQWMTF